MNETEERRALNLGLVRPHAPDFAKRWEPTLRANEVVLDRFSPYQHPDGLEDELRKHVPLELHSMLPEEPVSWLPDSPHPFDSHLAKADEPPASKEAQAAILAAYIAKYLEAHPPANDEAQPLRKAAIHDTQRKHLEDLRGFATDEEVRLLEKALAAMDIAAFIELEGRVIEREKLRRAA